MRRLVLLVALAGLSLVIYFSSRGTGPSALGALQGSGESALDAPQPASEELTADPQPGLFEPGTIAATRAEVEAPAAPLAPEPEPVCVLQGRLADTLGAPLADVAVQLMAYKGWSEDSGAELLVSRYKLRGFEIRSNAAGEFKFELPVPSTDRTILKVLPDRFHDSHTRYFDSKRASSSPSLAAGVRDLGEIRLGDTGALRGRVTDEGGRPLADVKMGVGSSPSSTFSRDTWTEQDGTFVLGHAPLGTYALKAKLEGYISGYMEPVTVQAGVDNPGKDFVLRSAPSIQGFVRDEFGAPIEGVRFWGWPSSSGSGAGAMSDAQGAFTVFLPQDEPYTLSAKRDGYETWGDGTRSVTYEPGTRELEIVMNSIAKTRFLVQDAETGVIVENFGLNILENNGSKSSSNGFTERRRPPLVLHAAGVAEATARPGVDLYVIAAEGYLLASGDVAHDLEGQPLQTVKLERGGSMRGRLLDGEVPVVGALVEVQRIGSRRRGVLHLDNNGVFVTSTDEAGAFELLGLSVSEYRVTISPAAGADLVLFPSLLRPKEDRDLGDLSFLPGASIAGRVQLPPGVDPTGLEVQLGGYTDGRLALVDGSGRFQFEQLAAGKQSLQLQARPGKLAESAAVEIELVAGQVLDVTLDARDRAMCEVTLSIKLHGMSSSGVSVTLKSTEQPNSNQNIGKCDETGRVVGRVRAWGDTSIAVYIPGLGFVQHPEAHLNLTPQGQVTSSISFEFASLSLQLPAGVDFPETGFARVSTHLKGSERVVRSASFDFEAGDLVTASSKFQSIRDGRLWIAGQAPGLCEVTIELGESVPASEVNMVEGQSYSISSSGGKQSILRDPYFTRTREVLLVASQESLLILD